MKKISMWLDEIGLGKYAPAFAANEIDFEVLPELTEDDLKDLGLPIGPRRKLLKEIVALGLARTAPSAKTRPESQIAPPDGSTMLANPSTGERRHLTVLVCDLVGSTALSSRFDPEDMTRIIDLFRRHCEEVVRRYDGHVTTYMGDGLMACFGYPQAHEDDVERAIRAGLAMVDGMSGLDFGIGTAIAAQLRVGIATGEVVVSGFSDESGAKEISLVGRAPNLAARIQTVAQPNSIVVGRRSKKLVSEVFEFQNLGEHNLKGFDEPIEVWQVTAERSVESRFEVRSQGPWLSPLVGRDAELQLMLHRWTNAKEGDGQVLLLSGEPGIGKSRLLRAFYDMVRSESHERFSCYCSTYHRDSAFYPIARQLERRIGIQLTDDFSTRLDKIEVAVAASGLAVHEHVPFLASLLSVPIEGRYPPVELDPHNRKNKILGSVLAILAQAAAQRPLLFTVEDIHWADPSTLELLDWAIERWSEVSGLLTITYRSDFVPPWRDQTRITGLSLSNLGQTQSAQIAKSVAGGKALPQEVMAQIISRASGIPLFVEELVKMTLESGLLVEKGDHYDLAGSLRALAIPNTLKDSLVARLDRLGTIKPVAQLCAVIGKSFTFDLVRAVSNFSESDLQYALNQLVRGGFLSRQGAPPNSTYVFHHAMFLDAAYETLLLADRRQIHGRVARVLEESFPEVLRDQPEILAQHCEAANQKEKCIELWMMAGGRALARSANQEAVRFFERALIGLDSVERPDRFATTAIDARMGLCEALTAVGELDRSRTYLREAESLATRTSDRYRSALIAILTTVADSHSGLLDEAIASGERAHNIALSLNDPELLISSAYALGEAYQFSGDCRKTLEIVEQCWNDFKDELRGKNFGPNGASSVLFLSTLSITHALLGNFPMAVQYGEQAYQVARDSGRAYAQIYALHALGISYLDRGEVDKAITYFQQGVDVLTSHEILFLYPGIAGELGYALALAGKIQDAHAVLGRMLAESDQMNLSFFQALGRAYLGMVCLIDNDPESAERHGLRALAIATRFGFRWIETLSMACLGSVYSHDKTINLEKAESYLRRSATLSDALSLRPEHARCLLKLSEFEYKTGQVNEGKQNLLRAVELLQEMNMERWLMEANKILGKSDWLSVN